MSNATVTGDTEAFFAPGGGLSRMAAGRWPFEHRPQQAAMASAVARALETSEHLAVEAGTGVGKSFAYLVPALQAAARRRIQVLVSTYTISLQEQLLGKDLPFLQRALETPFKAVLVKGRTNYLCLRRLERVRREPEELFEKTGRDALGALRRWAGMTAEGSLQDMEDQPPSALWSRVCAEQGNCLGQHCPHFQRCFFMNARRTMRDAQLLVANHHLFFSDLNLRREGAPFLPPYGAVILDEAHQVPGVATDHFGLRLSPAMGEQLLNRLHHAGSGRGLLAALRAGEAAAAVERVREESDRYYRDIEEWARFDDGNGQRAVPEPLSLGAPLIESFGALAARLRPLADGVKDADLRVELDSVLGRLEGLRGALAAFSAQQWDDHVYWVEREGRRLQTVLHSAPLDVAPLLEEALFRTVPCVVLTSATLAVGGRLDYFCSQTGAGDCATLSVGSPFDYARQMTILLPKSMPDPNDEEHFAPAAARAICRLTVPERGRAFVLFTSARLMGRVAALCEPLLSAQGLVLLRQGAGLPRHVLLERFRRAEAAVLFGLDSFWMGVDVPGRALSTVIITRLPFAVPTHPLQRARMERLRRDGGNPFRDGALPEAVLKFRQGVGRLIRTATDEGRIVVLDRRIADRWYGKIFFSSLPECPVLETALEEGPEGQDGFF